MNDINKGLTDQKTIYLYLIAVFTLVSTVVGLVLSATGALAAIGIKENLIMAFPDIMLKYMFIVAAVERSAAVFVGMFRNQGKVDWTLRINRLNEILGNPDTTLDMLVRVYEREKRVIDVLVKKQVTFPININIEYGPIPKLDDCKAYLLAAKHVYEFQRATFNSISSRHVSKIVFVFGIVLASFGLSVFGDLMVFSNVTSSIQSLVLRLSDIIITGGLLGGGSAGLNVLANKLGEKVA